MKQGPLAMLQGNRQGEISMALKPTNRGRAERIRINLGDPQEIAYWSKRFGCSPAELKEAVRTVGVVNAEVVCTFIARRKENGIW